MRIDTSFALALIENYAKNHWATINSSCPSLPQSTSTAPIQDSRSVWFSLSDLQDFISEFEDAGNQENLGVRIYFGEYSADLLSNNNNSQSNSNNAGPSQSRSSSANTSQSQTNNASTSQFDSSQYNGLHTLIMVPTLLGSDGFNHDFDPETGDSIFDNSSDICALNHGTLTPPPFHLDGSSDANVGQDFMLFCDQKSQAKN